MVHNIVSVLKSLNCTLLKCEFCGMLSYVSAKLLLKNNFPKYLKHSLIYQVVVGIKI